MPVYFMSHDNVLDSPIKIGKSKNIFKRRNELQTGNPYLLHILGWIDAEDSHVLEKALHKEFENYHQLGEWFNITTSDVLNSLSRAGQKGFVAKNANAFEIVGYDKDAVPEFVGVCDWVDLDFEKCCPFCGCLCGMHFQEASLMYYCISCRRLTGFNYDDEWG